MARTNPYGLKVDLDAENGAVVVNLRKREGEGFVQIESETFPLSAVHADIRPLTDLYGLSKALQDRCSQVDAGPDKLGAMREVAALFAAGEWEKERAGGAPTVSAEVEALAEIKGVSVAAIQKALRTQPADVREKILASPRVVAKAAEIKASRESDAASVDLTDLA